MILYEMYCFEVKNLFPIGMSSQRASKYSGQPPMFVSALEMGKLCCFPHCKLQSSFRRLVAFRIIFEHFDAVTGRSGLIRSLVCSTPNRNAQYRVGLCRIRIHTPFSSATVQTPLQKFGPIPALRVPSPRRRYSTRLKHRCRMK